jgi:hypothetical protein
MTTLRTFQNEIEDIHNREISRQRAQADMEKEQKTSKGKAKVEANTTASPVLTGTKGTEAARFQGMEELILVCLKLMCKSQLLIILFRLSCSLQLLGIMILPVTKWLRFLLRITGNMCCASDNSLLMRNCLRVISRTKLLDGLERLGPSKRSTLCAGT